MAERRRENVTGEDHPGDLQYELCFGAMSLALGALSNARPNWLRAVSLPAWYPRYAELQARIAMPQTPQQRQAFLENLQMDILYLLDMIEKTEEDGLESLPEILVLRKIKEEMSKGKNV